MKTVSSENLARFKENCDATYQKKGSGGITNAEVIEYAETLPTASETSPNFVQTPDGTLYRKKAVESGGLLGTWIFKDTIDVSTDYSFLVKFKANGVSFDCTRMEIHTGFNPEGKGLVYYENETLNSPSVYVYQSPSDEWFNDSYKTIQITDISSLTNVDEFTQWLTANATGGGASVSYEYVAMQEVPTPTTADNGKVLGVTNGAYALQEASGGGGISLYTMPPANVGETIDVDGSVYTIINSTLSDVSWVGNDSALAEKMYNGSILFIIGLEDGSGFIKKCFPRQVRVAGSIAQVSIFKSDINPTTTSNGLLNIQYNIDGISPA